MGHSQIEGESLATHWAAANSAGKTVMESGGRPPETRARVASAKAKR